MAGKKNDHPSLIEGEEKEETAAVEDCLEPRLLERWKSDFRAYFTPHYFQKGDDFSLEIRQDGTTFGYRDGRCETRGEVAEVSVKAGSCLGRALVENEIHQRKQGIVNLLTLLLK